MAERVGGWQTVFVLLERAPQRVRTVFLDERRDDGRARRVREACAHHGIALQVCDASALDRLMPETRHQGVVAVVSAAPPLSERELKCDLPASDRALYLVLDGVQDPHNLGACLRSAAAAGAHGVIVPRDRSAPVTAAVRKVASGGTELLPLYRVANLARALKMLGEGGVWRIGLDERAEKTVHACALDGPVALVLGGEESGLRELTRRHCDELARIPTPGALASLNVSVASAVALFEAVRQRTLKADPWGSASGGTGTSRTESGAQAIDSRSEAEAGLRPRAAGKSWTEFFSVSQKKTSPPGNRK